MIQSCSNWVRVQTGEQGEACVAAPSRRRCLFLQGRNPPSPAAPLLFRSLIWSKIFPLYTQCRGPLRRTPGKAAARCDQGHVLLHSLPFSVHPLAVFIGKTATWKNKHKVYSEIPHPRLRIPPSNSQNILASVSRGGNLEKCQTLLITMKLLLKE